MTTILIVDDDPLQASLLMSLLGRQFGNVCRVNDAAEALCLIEQPEFAGKLSLVITGHHITGIGGPAFVAELHARKPDLPVLVLSASDLRTLRIQRRTGRLSAPPGGWRQDAGRHQPDPRGPQARRRVDCKPNRTFPCTLHRVSQITLEPLSWMENRLIRWEVTGLRRACENELGVTTGGSPIPVSS